jgi:peptide alpha-N-acetyltransferase
MQSAYNVQVFLDNTSKAQCEEELKMLLDAPSMTTQQALKGLDYLDQWESDEKVRDAYRDAAAKRWPEATVFQKN